MINISPEGDFSPAYTGGISVYILRIPKLCKGLQHQHTTSDFPYLKTSEKLILLDTYIIAIIFDMYTLDFHKFFALLIKLTKKVNL